MLAPRSRASRSKTSRCRRTSPCSSPAGVERHGEVRGRQSRQRHVTDADVNANHAARSTPSSRSTNTGIGGEREHLVADVHDAEVRAVGRPEADVRALGAGPARDVVREELLACFPSSMAALRAPASRSLRLAATSRSFCTPGPATTVFLASRQRVGMPLSSTPAVTTSRSGRRCSSVRSPSGADGRPRRSERRVRETVIIPQIGEYPGT